MAGGSIVQTYTLPKDGFELKYDLRLLGLERTVAQEPLTFTFVDEVRQTEQDLKQNRNHTTINHYLATGDQGSLAKPVARSPRNTRPPAP